MTVPATTPESTKDALLDAAEHLFADHGIANTSVRAVTTAAGANVAAVNYHFGSKEGLILAVLDRRLGPVNAERLERLDRAQAEGGPDGPELEEILKALLVPAFQLSEAGLRRFTRMLARSHFETDPSIEDLIVSSFEGVIERFVAALTRALPHLTPSEVMYRLHFAIGAMAMTVANPDAVVRHSGGLTSTEEAADIALLTRRLVTFVDHAFRAPSVEATAPSGAGVSEESP